MRLNFRFKFLGLKFNEKLMFCLSFDRVGDFEKRFLSILTLISIELNHLLNIFPMEFKLKLILI